jgi:hypothetical protein
MGESGEHHEAEEPSQSLRGLYQKNQDRERFYDSIYAISSYSRALETKIDSRGAAEAYKRRCLRYLL